MKEPILLVLFEKQSLVFSSEDRKEQSLTVIKQYASMYGPINFTLHAKYLHGHMYTHLTISPSSCLGTQCVLLLHWQVKRLSQSSRIP